MNTSSLSPSTSLTASLLVAGLVGGPSFAAKTSLVLSDTVGTNFYIWCAGRRLALPFPKASLLVRCALCRRDGDGDDKDESSH